MIGTVYDAFLRVRMGDVVRSFIVASYFRLGRKVLSEQKAALGTTAQVKHFARGVMVDTSQRALQLRPATQRASFYRYSIHGDFQRYRRGLAQQPSAHTTPKFAAK